MNDSLAVGIGQRLRQSPHDLDGLAHVQAVAVGPFLQARASVLPAMKTEAM